SAGGMEDEHLVAILLHDLAGRLDAWRRHAKHGGGDEGLFQAHGLRSVGFRLHHADHGVSSIRQYRSADTVQAADVHDRVQHHNVANADIWLDLAACQSADH